MSSSPSSCSPDRSLALLAELVAFPTIAGTPNLELVERVAQRLEDVGATVATLPATGTQSVNLHATLGPADEPGGLLLAAHSDVVAVEGQPWSTDPFRLRVSDGSAYGRGTADMKGFLATVLAALEHADVRSWRRPLHLAVSSDEELGCRGVPSLLDHLAGLPVGPARAVVGEPTELRVVSAHKGKAAVRLHFRGRAAHSSRAPEGVNAVAHAGSLIADLLDIQAHHAAGPQHPGFCVPYSTIGIGPIAGGVAVNIVPDSCTLEIEVRTLPELEPRSLMDQVLQTVHARSDDMRAAAPEAGITVEALSSYPGLRPINAAFADGVAALVGIPTIGVVDFGTEAGLYQRALDIPVVVCGPGSMAHAHQADERVAVEQLARGEAFVRELLGASLSRPAAP